MFEKEAEKYATRECCMTCNNINHFCKEKCECWTFAKKGAEFGYNKRNTELAKAKKIIRNCLNLRNSVMTEEAERALIKEAEQFISEVEQ